MRRIGQSATLVSLAAPLPPRFRVSSGKRAASAEGRQARQELEAAAAAEAFVLHYQPRVRLQSGRPSGAEALLRWPQRRRGLIPPAAFLPLAEECGAIIPIGAWALRAACAAALEWPGETVSVNVSARQFAEGAVLRQVASALDESGLQPESLVIELSETMLVDIDPDAVLTLSAIRDLGVGIAVDNFGVGLGSLSVLRRLPLTALKLDRCLVRALPDDREDTAVVRAVVAASQALGLSVVAGGVETEAQRELLAEIGCDEGQGFLFGRPVPADQLHAKGAPRLEGRAPSMTTM